MNVFGTDSFTYEATDETGTSAPATVTINVISENDGPIAGNNTYNVDEENGYIFIIAVLFFEIGLGGTTFLGDR